MRPGLRAGLVTVVCAMASAGAAGAAQVPLAPGPLARAHAKLEGVGNCSKCHEAGHELSPALCLKCHTVIAERIAKRKGVHRAVTSGCQPCHVEHRGPEADLRQLNARTFDHATEAGYALEGRHAKLAADCAACHKTRTFLGQRTSCESCHKDVHHDTLGRECTRCHATDLPFKETRTRFDHAQARFVLAGAHRSVACEKCHVSAVFRGLHFDSCSSCHKEPHRHALGPACTSCHTPERWATRTIEHDRTGFTLVGAHVRVACERCHRAGIVKAMTSDRCAACHVNPHRRSMNDDCRACHTEATFRDARFDHAVRTPFPLVGKHEGLACRKCHTSITTDNVPLARRVVDFAGASAVCASCHKDQHKGEFGSLCDACHRPATFKAAGFVHPGPQELFGGRHAAVACVRCHVRGPLGASTASAPAPAAARAKVPPTACAGCHTDVHLGQVGTACDACHAVAAARFAPVRFTHDRAAFVLTGRHRSLDCAKCHVRETQAFPSGVGSARRYKPMQTACASCHKDPHLGQTDNRCDSCHKTVSFRLLTYTHRGLEDFFGGFHGRLPCRSCHPTESGQFPAGRGIAIRLKVGRTCKSCHPQF